MKPTPTIRQIHSLDFTIKYGKRADARFLTIGIETTPRLFDNKPDKIMINPIVKPLMRPTPMR